MVDVMYLNPKLPIEQRVKDLLSRMNDDEKVAQMGCVLAAAGRFSNMEEQLKHGIGQIGTLLGCMSADKNIELVRTVQSFLLSNTRLKIPALFHVETLNGAQMAGATTFPIPIGMGASWDDTALGMVAEAICKETATSGFRLALAPVMDVARDPRWGRMGETYGENATLMSAMCTAYVKGLQGKDLRKSIAATAKHFIGYAMSESGLNMATSHICDRELREVYAKPFEAAIRLASLRGIMNAYQDLGGVPIAASREILTELLRGELGFEGLTVSDYGSIEKSHIVFKIAEDVTRAGMLALEAGLDTETPASLCYGEGFVNALKSGKVSREQVDIAVSRVLRLKFELGLFENPYASDVQYKEALQCKEHLDTAYDMTCKSFVLLKNENNILPLSSEYRKIAVIGPSADNLRNLFGGYTYVATYESMLGFINQSAIGLGLEGVVLSREQQEQSKALAAMMSTVDQTIMNNYPGVQTVFQAIVDAFPNAEVKCATGCEIASDDKSGFEEAVKLANECDVTILVLGGKNGSGSGCTMGENVDSSDVGLPGVQEKLAKELASTGKPIVIVHMDGRPLSSVWAKENAAAILEVWHPGQCGSKAIADTLKGIRNPGGKLPVTAVRNSGQIPVYSDQPRGSGMSYKGISNSGITQGYYNEPAYPLYTFGYGCSYTTFKIDALNVSSERIGPEDKIDISCLVKNTGKMPGDEVVQLYFSDKFASVVRPVKELAGFCRLSLNPGESKKIIFEFRADQTAFIGADMKWRIEEGEFDIYIGNSSENPALKAMVCVTKTKTLDSGMRTFFSKAKVREV